MTHVAMFLSTEAVSMVECLVQLNIVAGVHELS